MLCCSVNKAFGATPSVVCFFFFNDPATTEIYTLSLHDALPISRVLPLLMAQVGNIRLAHSGVPEFCIVNLHKSEISDLRRSCALRLLVPISHLGEATLAHASELPSDPIATNTPRLELRLSTRRSGSPLAGRGNARSARPGWSLPPRW